MMLSMARIISPETLTTARCTFLVVVRNHPHLSLIPGGIQSLAGDRSRSDRTTMLPRNG
jgi:hypothetical protein